VDKDINLYDLMPLFRLNQGDGGFYIDKSTVVSRVGLAATVMAPSHRLSDPDTREQRTQGEQ
jgi:3-polyprenyl-4-hydroxybenzoate decarboxylase